MTTPATVPGVLTGYDSTRPELIPASAEVIFPYADGLYKWSPAALARFPHARLRKITVLGDYRIANICDVERGDVPATATAQYKAATAATFIRGWNGLHPGEPATIYCSRSTLEAVQSACTGLSYRVWLATLDGSRPRCYSGAGIVAIQHTDTGKYDVSEVYDAGWLRAA